MAEVTLPPRQQLAAPGKWPVVGERAARESSEPWLVHVCGLVATPMQFTLAEIMSWPAVTRALDIHCVTRWSKLGVSFTGVPLREVILRCVPLPAARFVSFVARSDRDHSTSLPLADALAPENLVAWQAEDAPLAPEHGGPLRTVMPGRYFYKSLKWLVRLELLAEDRLGHWEAQAGYHNHADPWREQRYIAPALSRQEAAAVLATRNVSGRDLRGLDASGHNLDDLLAATALLRDARFTGCSLQRANFERANLTNAHFDAADLRQASFLNADVEGASFAGADLRGANFSGASLFGCTFGEEQNPPRPALVDSTTILVRNGE